MTEFTEDFPPVTITGNPDSTITVEQSFSGNVERVALHHMHVRFMAEKLGLLPAPSAEDPAAPHRTEQVPVLLVDLARMERALLRIRKMGAELSQSLDSVARHCQDDLTYEIALASALFEFAAFVCEDFEPAPAALADTKKADVLHPSTATSPAYTAPSLEGEPA